MILGRSLRFFAKNYRSEANPQVFFEVTQNGKNIGRMVFELYENHNPKTSENFR